jgi:hypothetical protein
MANENVCQWRIVSSFSIKMGKNVPWEISLMEMEKIQRERKINQSSVLLLLLATAHSLVYNNMFCAYYIKFFFSSYSFTV